MKFWPNDGQGVEQGDSHSLKGLDREGAALEDTGIMGRM